MQVGLTDEASEQKLAGCDSAVFPGSPGQWSEPRFCSNSTPAERVAGLGTGHRKSGVCRACHLGPGWPE